MGAQTLHNQWSCTSMVCVASILLQLVCLPMHVLGSAVIEETLVIFHRFDPTNNDAPFVIYERRAFFIRTSRFDFRWRSRCFQSVDLVALNVFLMFRRQYAHPTPLFFFKTRSAEVASTLEKGFGEQRELREDKVISLYKHNRACFSISRIKTKN